MRSCGNLYVPIFSLRTLDQICPRSSVAILACCSWYFFFSSRRRHTRLVSDWSSDVCSSNLACRLLLEKKKKHDRTRGLCQKPIQAAALKKAERTAPHPDQEQLHLRHEQRAQCYVIELQYVL